MKQQNNVVKNFKDLSNVSIEDVLEEPEFKELVQYKANLYFMFGGDKEDLIQEGMIGLVKAYNSYDKSHGASFKTYADMIVQHEICNAVIKANRKRHSPLNNSLEIKEALVGERVSSPEEEIVFQDIWEDLMSNKEGIFGSLEHEVLLKLVEGKTYKEIAEELVKSPKQIDNAIQRVRNKIKCYII